MNTIQKTFSGEDDALRKKGYILGQTLGQGSYAKVKAAFHEEWNTKLAVKIINRKKAPKDFQIKFLPRELEILKSLRHINVIGLYDIIESGAKVYICMEIAGHGDLLEYIKLRGAIQEERARNLFYQLANGIEYLHLNNIVHRDLKCENLLLDSNNTVKISDFGFARRVEKSELSRTFCGSAAYAAPEILQGIPYDPPLYDVWSMGVILYIMITGSMPYDDSNIRKMIREQTEKKVGFSRSCKASQNCRSLILEMLEPIPEKRHGVTLILEHAWLKAERDLARTQLSESLTGADSSDSADSTSSQDQFGETKPVLSGWAGEPDQAASEI